MKPSSSRGALHHHVPAVEIGCRSGAASVRRLQLSLPSDFSEGRERLRVITGLTSANVGPDGAGVAILAPDSRGTAD